MPQLGDSRSVVEEFTYTTLIRLFLCTVNGRGRAYRIFIFWTGKFEFRLTSNISAVDSGTSTKFHVEKFTIEFYTQVEYALPAVHLSPARGPKRKTFPQISRKREGQSLPFWYRSIQLGSRKKLLEYAPPF